MWSRLSLAMMRPASAVWTGLIAVCAVGCWQPEQEGTNAEGPGGRDQPLALSPQKEYAVGRRAYEEVMQEYRGRVLPEDSPESERARRILARLVRAASIEPLQREINLRIRGYRFDWEVNVIREPQVNAFCLPAGKIFLFTGMLKVIGDDDDFLATVLSHEMAHALAHHGSERIAREQSGASGFRKLSYDRAQEAEADHIGVFLMTFAGYDPTRAPAFWERMSRTQGRGGPSEMFSDHPSNEERVRSLREWAPKALAGRRAFEEGRIAPPRR